jgi:hypothetical protein
MKNLKRFLFFQISLFTIIELVLNNIKKPFKYLEIKLSIEGNIIYSELKFSENKRLSLPINMHSQNSVLFSSCFNKKCFKKISYSYSPSKFYHKIKENITMLFSGDLYNTEFSSDFIISEKDDRLKMKLFFNFLKKNINSTLAQRYKQKTILPCFSLGFTEEVSNNQIMQMKNEGILSSANAYFYYNSTKDEYRLLIGGYNEQNEILNHTNFSPVKYNNIHFFKAKSEKKEYSWFIWANGIQVGQSFFKVKQQIVIDTMPLLFDSDILIQIPKTFYFENKVFEESSRCQLFPSGYFICSCIQSDYETIFPSFLFFINGTTLTFLPKEYLKRGYTGRECYLKIGINYDNEFWVLSKNLLNKYIMINNYESNQIAFVQLAKLKIENNVNIIILVIMSFLILICSLPCFIVAYKFIRPFISRFILYFENH